VDYTQHPDLSYEAILTEVLASGEPKAAAIVEAMLAERERRRKDVQHKLRQTLPKATVHPSRIIVRRPDGVEVRADDYLI
jgi:hypothetical protein